MEESSVVPSRFVCGGAHISHRAVDLHDIVKIKGVERRAVEAWQKDMLEL